MNSEKGENECSGPWLFRGARVADPRTNLWGQRDVLVVGNRIRAIDSAISSREATAAAGGVVRTIEAEGLWIWPGLIDLHVHFREPGYTHKETFSTGGRAAISGGYTCVVCEPNTDPPLADPSTVRKTSVKASHDTPLRVAFKAAMSEERKGEKPADIEALAKMLPVVALSDDGDPIVKATLMDRICRRSAAVGLPLCPHCEDTARSRKAYADGIDAGFPVGEWKKNEAAYIKRDAELAVQWGTPIHFSHVSLEESLEVLREIRSDNPQNPVTAEVTPHHLLLDETTELEQGEDMVNPPLRAKNDRKALCDALIAGKIDAIASDHAPHQPGEKREGASGFIGVETSLSLILTHFVIPGLLSPLAAARLMSTQPADILGLPGGEVVTGGVADLVVVDPEAEWKIETDKVLSLSQNTPFREKKATGRAVGVMIDGDLVLARESLKNRMKSNEEE